MMCTSDSPSSLNSIVDVGKIVGIVIGSLLALAVLICIIVTIYLLCCKRKPDTKIWAQPCSRPQGYGQSMTTFPYTHYSQGPIRPSQIGVQRITEEPPPAYEEIAYIQDPNRKV